MLLTIICLLAGFMSSYPFLIGKFKSIEKLKDLLKTYDSYVGLISIAIGLWHLISPTKSSGYWGNLDFIGDLIPSLLAIIVGFFLSQNMFSYINLSKDPAKSLERKSKIQNVLIANSVNIGLTTFLFGIIHIIDLVGSGYPLI